MIVVPKAMQVEDADMIETHGLTKVFQQRTAVEALNLHVRSGEIYGFLGPNGAGKSTTARMLTTILTPTSGTATINGFDVVRKALDVRKQIAVIPQAHIMGYHLDVYQNIFIYLMFRGFSRREAHARTERALERFDLGALKRFRPHMLSQGQRRRVQVARALVSGAKAMFLDEPSVGLDPVVRQETWSCIREAREAGATVFLTTQMMEEAEALCSRVGLMYDGKLVLDGSVADLKSGMGVTRIELALQGLTPDNTEKIVQECKRLPFVKQVNVNAPMMEAVAEGTDVPVALILDLIKSHGASLVQLNIYPPTLEDIYLKVVRG